MNTYGGHARRAHPLILLLVAIAGALTAALVIAPGLESLARAPSLSAPYRGAPVSSASAVRAGTPHSVAPLRATGVGTYNAPSGSRNFGQLAGLLSYDHGQQAIDTPRRSLAVFAAEAGDAGGTTATKTFQTHTKVNPDTGEVYAGRTSGTGSPLENLASRDAGHAYNDEGFGPAQLDQSSESYAAIRGLEQQLIEYYQDLGVSANKINGISPTNANLDWYLESSLGEFGPLP